MVSRIITLLLPAALSCIVTIGGNVEVIFTPSPIIPEGGTAVYNCSTNNSAVTITWILNKTVPATTLNTRYGVTTPGTSTSVSSLTIPGLVNPFNNTEVQCVAYGHGVGDFSPPPVILRIQGRLEAPTAVQSNDSCCYHFKWSPPFTLSGVPILGYNINVTNNDGAILLNDTVIDTEWEYCPKEFGDHIFSVAALNYVGEGDVAFIKLLMNHYSIKLMERYRDAHQYWIIVMQILFEAKARLRCKITHVSLNCTNSELKFESDNFSDGLVTNVMFNISTTDDKNHTVTTLISHENNVTAEVSNLIPLRFFDVSNYTDLSNVNTNVSFQCTFVNGSRADGCCIVLKNKMSDKNYSVDIIRENSNTMTKEGAIQEVVEPGEYQIDVFDINENNSLASLPAFISTIVIVTDTSFTSTATSTATTTSQVPTPTPSATTSTGSPAGPSEVTGPKPNIGIIVGSIIGIVIFIVIAVLMIIGIVYVCHHKNKNMTVDCKEKGINPSSHNSGHSEIHVSTRPKLPVLNYIDIELDPDAPAVPPPYDPDKTIYSELQKETTAISQTNVAADEYNTLNHNSNNTCPVDVSNAGMYSTINNGQEQLQLTGAVNSSPVYDTVPSEQESKMVPSQYSMVYIQRELTHKDLSELVIPRLNSKWYEVGLALELTPDQLNDIEDNHQGISDVFQIWEDSGKKPFTWNTLLSVLSSPDVNEYELANELQAK